MAIPVETFFLKPDAQGTLQAQIQQMIAEGILSGRLRRGEKLPSSRKLAAHLGVSRITVTLAYTELQASDYLAARDRSGYFVSENAPEPLPEPELPAAAEAVDWDKALSRQITSSVVPGRPSDWARYRYPFVYGQADPALFDHAHWRLCAIQALGQKDFTALTTDYYDQDDPELVEFILRHSLPRRGIMARPEEVLVTLGAQNALWLAAQVLLGPGRRAVMENPSYPPLKDTLAQIDCDVTAVDVDAEGLPPAALPEACNVIFTTPSHQCPTSATMPRPRREALLAAARARNALVVEDDYEFEMSFLSPPSPALKSLDGDGRVIYVGSFSKVLFPGLRLGYLVGPEPFIRQARALRANVLRHPPGHIQRTAAYFLRLGHYDAQIKRMSRLLAERRAVMQAALLDHGLTIAGSGTFGGSSFWMKAPEGVDMEQVRQQLQADSVLIESGDRFFTGAQAPRNHYRLAYSSIPSDRIAEGVARIAQAIADVSA
ncbi:MAG: PLP-dependent aminotransferase family protein [Pseudomonadota bacterium]|nr:PLP-dependent aminotransferase family protein [Pseudomonadota bacterium]